MRHNYLSADLAGEIGGQNRHVVLFGQVGSGKTSIFNLLVSHSKDIKRGGKEKFGPIVGSCRLGHIGEVTLIDTAGLNDVSELDGENATSVRNTVRRADIAIYVINIQEFDETARQTYQHAHDWLVKNDVPYLQVFNRCDEAYAGDIAKLKMEFPDAIFIS
ncbi:GTPase, partial [Butyricicoccus sp.]